MQRGHRRALVNPHPELERHAPQPERQPGRLHGRPGCLVDAGEVATGAGARLELVRFEVSERPRAAALDRVHRLLPRAHLGRIRRHPEPAPALEAGLNLGPKSHDLHIPKWNNLACNNAAKPILSIRPPK